MFLSYNMVRGQFTGITTSDATTVQHFEVQILKTQLRMELFRLNKFSHFWYDYDNVTLICISDTMFILK